MKTVVQFNPTVKNGSTGRIADQLGDFILNNNWNSVIVYSGRPKNKSNSELIKVGTYLDALFHACVSRLFNLHGRSHKFATLRLLKKLDEIKPDIIHFHNIHGYYLNYEILINYINKKNIPIVWTIHDFWSITGHCTYFYDVNCMKWKTQCNKCPKLMYYPKSLGFDNSANNHKHKIKTFSKIKRLHLVPVSNWVEFYFQQSYLKDKISKVIYNGIDLNIFRPRNNVKLLKQKYGFKEDSFIAIGLATTWGKRKGFFDYLKLIPLLPKNINIIMVGLNNDEMKMIPDSIIGLSKTENIDHLVDLYSLSDVVLNLSYQETFGLTPVEGFACGTPCISYNCTASIEIMAKEVGELVAPGDIQGVISSLIKLRNLGKSHYSKHCIERAAHLFSHKTNFKKYIDLYSEIISSND